MPGNPELRIELGNRIRRLRLSRGLKLQELAEEAGLSTGYLSDIERGRSALSGEKLASLARVLCVTADYLLTGERGDGISDQHDITIPKTLSAVAVLLQLSHEQTIRLLKGRRSIVARRSTTQNSDWTEDEWIAFYNNVKAYL